MLVLKPATQFRKDYKFMKKRGYKMDLLEDVLETLLQEKPLAEKYRDHALVGNYAGFRECHVLPDWLLIYQVDKVIDYMNPVSLTCFLNLSSS